MRYVIRFAPPASDCTATAMPSAEANTHGVAIAAKTNIEMSAHPARLTPSGTTGSLACAGAASMLRSRQRQPRLALACGAGGRAPTAPVAVPGRRREPRIRGRRVARGYHERAGPGAPGRRVKAGELAGGIGLRARQVCARELLAEAGALLLEARPGRGVDGARRRSRLIAGEGRR